MKFIEIFHLLVSGTPIKRKIWRGYWKYDTRTHEINIFTKEGEVIPLTETKDILFTLSSTLADDWEVATNENCDIEVK